MDFIIEKLQNIHSWLTKIVRKIQQLFLASIKRYNLKLMPIKFLFLTTSFIPHFWEQ